MEPYLTAERCREIGTVLIAEQGRFPCHKTTEEVADSEVGEMEETEDSQACAGARIFLAHQGKSMQLERIAGRCGMKVAEPDMEAPVSKSMEEFIGHHDSPEFECCSVCDAGCEAPAGMLVNGEVIDFGGSSEPLDECAVCGEPVCESCSVEGDTFTERICNHCDE